MRTCCDEPLRAQIVNLQNFRRRASCQALPTGRELDHPAFQCVRNAQPEGQTVVTLTKLVTPGAMRQCLQFAYTGTVDRSALDLRETRQAAEFLELPRLLMLLERHPFVAPEEGDGAYEECLKRRLQDVCLDQALFADVVFELDDGACAAHKAMLMARCDVMKAMFSGDFRESQAKVVSWSVGCKSLTDKFPQESTCILQFLFLSDRVSRCQRVHVPQAAVLPVHR